MASTSRCCVSAASGSPAALGLPLRAGPSRPAVRLARLQTVVVHARKNSVLPAGRPVAVVGQVAEGYTLWPTEIFVPKPLWTAAEVAVLLSTLMLLDAGYSGDWSRINIIDHDTELLLQQAFWFVIAAHGALAVWGMRVAADSGSNVPVAGLKVLAFGSLGLREIIVDAEANK